MSDKKDQKTTDRREAERSRLLALKARRWAHDDSTSYFKTLRKTIMKQAI
jgi:hypothetical protein